MAASVIVQIGCAWDPNLPTSACCSSPAPSALYFRLALPTPLLLWGQVWIELGKMGTPLFQLCEPGSKAGDPVGTAGGFGPHDSPGWDPEWPECAVLCGAGSKDTWCWQTLAEEGQVTQPDPGRL